MRIASAPRDFRRGQVTPAPAADGIARGASQTGVELLLACFFMFIIVAGGAEFSLAEPLA
jgi:hypothetical protein